MKRSRAHKHKASSTGDTPQSMAALAEGMADDFNNILTTVMGACSLIDRDDPDNRELLEYVALIRTSAERAADLSDRLMHVSSSQQGCAPSGNHKCLIPVTAKERKSHRADGSGGVHPDGASS